MTRLPAEATVLDTSVLSNFAHVDRLDLVAGLPRVVTVAAVERELDSGVETHWTDTRIGSGSSRFETNGCVGGPIDVVPADIDPDGEPFVWRRAGVTGRETTATSAGARGLEYPRGRIETMTNCVPYHHPENDRLSVEFVSFDRETAAAKLTDLDGDEFGRIETFDFSREFHVVYTGRELPDSTADLEYDLRDEVAEMSEPDQIITTRLLDVFESIAEEKYDREAERLGAYKQIEIDKIPDALSRVTWTDSVSGAAGELLSSLILRHALPNANHRTSLGMMSLYFQSISERFQMPATATDTDDWEAWVNEFIEDSKKLLTVRRNVPRFSYLYDAGCTVVERKDGLQIQLSEYDLTMDHWDAMEQYAVKHKTRSVEFAEATLERAGTAELRREEPLSKSEFANRLRRME